MKKLPSVRVVLMTMIAIILVNIIFSFDYNVKQDKRDEVSVGTTVAYLNRQYDNGNLLSINEIRDVMLEVEASTYVEEKPKVNYSEVYPEIVYKGMTLNELGEKLDRSLKSSLSGYGHVIATYSIEYGVDPYMAVAIMLHETGCDSGTCSMLTSECNNVGGMKGGPSCGNGSYLRFDTMEEGIESFMRNLSNNYIKKGLTTPEAINTKYAASQTWSNRVRYYMNKIENN